MSWQAGAVQVTILKGDLTTEDVDAIVNAANNDLRLGGGVAGAISRAGGPAIQEECDRIGSIAVGDAAITGGGHLKARYVIHAASMGLGGRTTGEALRTSTRRSLELARDKALRSVAFPAVGTGIAHFPMDQCASIMIDEVVSHAERPGSLTEVRFVLYGDEALRAFEKEAGARLAKESRQEEGEQKGDRDTR